MNPAVIISARDNVATALEALEPGQTIRIDHVTLNVNERIPRGHKVALCAIRSGEPVVKYGSPIGLATSDIGAGTHVHTHNVASARGRGDLAPSSAAVPQIAESLDAADAPSSPAAPRIAEPPDADAETGLNGEPA
jgi:altronate hydrolase